MQDFKKILHSYSYMQRAQHTCKTGQEYFKSIILGAKWIKEIFTLLISERENNVCQSLNILQFSRKSYRREILFHGIGKRYICTIRFMYVWMGTSEECKRM